MYRSAGESLCDSPSVKTMTSRWRGVVEKKCPWITGTSASSVDARPVLYGWLGGGKSIPTDVDSVRRNSAVSVVGIRSGSVLSVIDAIPTGMSPRRARNCSASRFARASRVGAPGAARALIDSDVSKLAANTGRRIFVHYASDLLDPVLRGHA